MFRLSTAVVVTLGFHHGPIRAPDQGGGGGNYRRPRHPSLSSPERRIDADGWSGGEICR